VETSKEQTETGSIAEPATIAAAIVTAAIVAGSDTRTNRRNRTNQVAHSSRPIDAIVKSKRAIDATVCVTPHRTGAEPFILDYRFQIQ
jgi:hypothetical protein